MQIKKTNSYEEMSRQAADIIIEELGKNPSMLLCAATGDTPTGMYKFLAERYKSEPQLFDKLRVIKLDEWGGIKMDDPATCETYIQENVIKPLNIAPDRYLTFESDPKDPETEMRNYDKKLHEAGGIDLCILGLGMDGHIALNEPANTLEPHAHVNALKDSTLHHPMVQKTEGHVGYGLTLGMEDIMNSKKILLLVNGSHKKEIFQKLLSEKISTELPASVLWMHNDCLCICDNEAFSN